MKIHVKIQNKTYEVRIGDVHTRPIVANVDGENFEVWPEETTIPPENYQPQTVSSSAKPHPTANIEPPTPSAADSIKQVKAPIPGIIISIAVNAGDKVTHGQELCILEAMKMKNIIRSSREGKVANICVKAGDSVQHSQVLLEFSD